MGLLQKGLPRYFGDRYNSEVYRTPHYYTGGRLYLLYLSGYLVQPRVPHTYRILPRANSLASTHFHAKTNPSFIKLFKLKL